MKRSVALTLMLLVVFMIPAIYAEDVKSDTWKPDNDPPIIHRYGDAWHSEPPTEGTYHTVTGREYNYQVVETGANGVKNTYIAGTAAAPDTVDSSWPKITDSSPTILRAPSSTSDGSTAVSSPSTSSSSTSTDTKTEQHIIERDGKPSIVVTTTTKDGDTSYVVQVSGQPASTSSEIPSGTSPDWSKINPDATNVIPIAGGGTRTLSGTDGESYVDRDRNGRTTTTVENGVITTNEYASDTRPAEWDASSPDTTNKFGQVETQTIRIDGVNGEIEVDRGDTGENPIPESLQNDEFYRAVIDAGISDIDEDTKFHSSGGVTTLDDGDIKIRGTSDRIVAQDGDKLTIYPRQDTTVNYGGATTTLAPGDSLRINAEDIDGAVVPGGNIDVTKLSPDQDYQLTTTRKDGTFEIERHTIDENGADNFIVRTRLNPETGILEEFSSSGTLEGTHRMSNGAETLDLSGLGLENDAESRAALDRYITNRFGPNAQVFQHEAGGLVNINGEWHKSDGKGGFEDCSGLRNQCGLTDEELDRLEREVIDPQLEEQGKPDTGSLQFAQFLESFKYYANAYTGFAGFSSIMFSEEFLQEWRDGVNTVMCDMLHLGGTECWSSKICEVYTDFEQPAGTLVGQTPDGSPRSVAHIEGERSPPIRFEGAGRKDLIDVFGEKVITVAGKQYDLSEPDVDLSGLPPIEAHVYKVTMSFSAQENSQINVRFSGDGRNVNYFTPNVQVQAGQIYSRIRSNPIHFISANKYDVVCITFNPRQETLSGKSVNEQCTGISEYRGAATTPVQSDGVSDGSGLQANPGVTGAPMEGQGI